MSRIDLHVHTAYSDGDRSPSEVVALAKETNVTTLAITDHDITSGIAEANQAGHQREIEIIPGVEVSSRFQGKETHILGYFIDPSHALLQTRLSRLRATRDTRIHDMVMRLQRLGIPIRHEDVLATAGTGSIGRPHIAHVLLQQGFVQSVREAFERYLAEGAAAYVERDLPSAEDAIAWINEAGGVAVLAHPHTAHVTDSQLERLCRTLQAAGLRGIEAWHSSHSFQQTETYRALARKLNLIVTGGSDFHGRLKPDIQVGIGRGDLCVPQEIVEPLRKLAAPPASAPRG